MDLNKLPIGLPEILILVIIAGGIWSVIRRLTKPTN